MIPDANTHQPSLHQAIREIYGTALAPVRWPQALQSIADSVGDVGAVLIYGRDDGRFGVIHSPSLDPCIAEYAADWSHRDIRALRARERGYFLARDVITDRDVLTPQEMNTDPFYRDFLTRHGLRYFAAAVVSPDPRVEVALSIQRVPKRAPYTDAELRVIGELGTHVENALRLGIRLMDAELVGAGLGAALTRIGMGVFALDSRGRVVFANPAAQALQGDGLDVVDDRLVASCSALSGLVEAEIARVIEDEGRAIGPPHPIVLARPKSGRRLALYVMPIPRSPRPAEVFLAHARAIVLVLNPDLEGPPDPSLVRDLLGLTLGEARVAALIGSGLPPREAAEQLGVSVETARTVLKRVFEKVGVSRQSELAALMSKLVLR
jgi:DNA-binding CsgD family transcriptional regulator/PAS domain-containing protein